ncbi:Xyloglucan 6-xylosyltransferase 1 [Linum grandiflorum]
MSAKAPGFVRDLVDRSSPGCAAFARRRFLSSPGASISSSSSSGGLVVYASSQWAIWGLGGVNHGEVRETEEGEGIAVGIDDGVRRRLEDIEDLKRNPNFPNFIRENKPRVLLVTGSSPKPCENPVGGHYLLKAVKNKIDYCRLHEIEIFYNMALLDAEMAGLWAKLPLIRKLLLSHPEIEFLWWMDSDAMFTYMTFELPWERYKDVNLVMHGWNEIVYDEKNWIGLNTGSFLLRNGQ